MGGLPCVGDVRLGYDERGLAKRDAIAHLGYQTLCTWSGGSVSTILAMEGVENMEPVFLHPADRRARFDELRIAILRELEALCGDEYQD